MYDYFTERYVPFTSETEPAFTYNICPPASVSSRLSRCHLADYRELRFSVSLDTSTSRDRPYTRMMRITKSKQASLTTVV